VSSEDDCACLLELPDQGRVVVRHISLDSNRSKCCEDIAGFDLIFHQDGHAMKRTLELPGVGIRLIKLLGLLDGTRVDRHHGVDSWAILVVCIIARQIELH
jgi:hypothetical protein